MVNREQEQARLLAESMGANGRAGRDLSWIVVICVLLAIVAVAIGATSVAADRARELDDPVLGTLLVLLAILAAGGTLYAVRRYRDAKKVQDVLEQLSYRDSLTGLPNRRFLGEGFDNLLEDARKSGGRVAVLFIDLSGFKKVNDTYGHEVGDQLMVSIADRLVEASEPSDVIVRYGGDEFVAFCADVTNVATAERMARRFLRIIETPFERGDELLRVSASIGIALAEERCTRPDEVLQDADAAMYQAKSRGAGSYAVFDRSMRDAITPSTAERKLRAALENGEFRLYYLPIVSIWTRRLVGVEARLCWEQPSGPPLGLEDVEDALDETGLSVPVGNWVLEEACRQTQRWQEQFPDRPALNMKVAVSSRQLAQTDFADRLRHALEVSGADPDRLCLEITEGALAHDVPTAWATLREVKATGLTLALNDFGTGFSSLNYLRRFSLDLLKIDKVFIDGLGQAREDDIIVEHVVGMAKALGIVTVADGIEREEQVEQLKSVNCDLAQGPYFSGPQPPHVIDELMARGSAEHEWQPVPDPQPTEATDAAVVEIPRFRDVQVTSATDAG